MTKFAGFLLAALLLPASSWAQKPADLPRARASAEVSIFNLDVVVTDAKGNAVHGLSADDFEVLHGKKAVRITNFREERGASRQPTHSQQAVNLALEPALAAKRAEAPRSPRYLALFIDRLALPEPAERKAFFDTLKGLLRKGLGPGDQAMVVTWDRSVKTVVPFSSDLADLDKAIDGAAALAVRQDTEKAEIEQMEVDDLESGWAGVAGNSPMNARLFVTQARQQIQGKAAALRGLIAIMAGLDGRKVIVVATRRLSLLPGKEFFGEGPDEQPIRDAIASADRRAGVPLHTIMDAVVEAANSSGVSLYTIYADVVDPEHPSAEFLPRMKPIAYQGRAQLNQRNELDNLLAIAEQTGGLVANSAKDVAAFTDHIAADLDSWYSLGYPAPAGGGRASSITVRVKDPSLEARVRRSLVEKTPEEQMRERVLANLFRPDEHARIPIAASAKVGTPSKDKVRITVEVKVPIGRLALIPGGKGATGAFSVFAAAVGAKGAFSETSGQRRPFEIPAADIERAKVSHFTYAFDIDASPDASICVGVWDELGHDAGFTIVRASAPGQS